ncbi:MAG: tetratricopeptide repeat protein [Candidatus Sericytochromatia bacterium]
MKEDLNRLGDPHLSPKEKLERTRALAEQGDAEAQYQVGFRYYLGDSGAQDFNAAEKWYTLAAEQGHTEAQFKLGKMKAQGKGIDQNDEQALRWLQLAADQGHPEAQELVGGLYARGQGVEADMVAAYQWYLLAEQAHDADLSAYLLEEGLAPDLRGPALAAALGDGLLAAELEVGLDRMQGVRKGLAARMSPEQVAEAERLAAAWRRQEA